MTPTQPTAEQLEVTQADRDLLDVIWKHSLNWGSREDMEQEIVRFRQATEARMAAAVEVERARCSKLAADYAASMIPTIRLGDEDSIYLTDHEQGQKDAAKRLSIMIYETAIRSQSNG